MLANHTLWINLAVALGIGLLIGAERERSKGTGPARSAAGIRTFTIASLLGAVSMTVSFWLLIASIACVMILATTAYFSKPSEDPGLTTEITLVFTVILGGLTMSQASLAAAIAVSVAILLAAKEPIHGFVLGTVTKEELNDFLILAAATLIILPLVPNQPIGPFKAINPRSLWLIVILVMTISALGHLTVRWLGDRAGLPLVGLVSGFISSIATIGAMGERVKEAPQLMPAAVAGAVLSNLATILLLALLLLAIDAPTLRALQWPLILGGLSVAIHGVALTMSSLKNKRADTYQPGKTFSVKTALKFAAVIATLLITSAALKNWFGQTGLLVASGLAGLADVHAATISIASLVSVGKLSVTNAVTPILLAFSFNTFTKAVIAITSGGKQFARLIIPALIIQLCAIWLGWWLF